MTPIEAKVVAAWREASKDLGIRFTSPFPFERDGKTFEALGLVREFGRRIGTVISVIDEPSSSVRWPRSEDYLVSQLSDSYARYDRRFFINTLDDWQFFGPDSEKPAWYSGRP
jgi:hypothetical protein